MTKQIYILSFIFRKGSVLEISSGAELSSTAAGLHQREPVKVVQAPVSSASQMPPTGNVLNAYNLEEVMPNVCAVALIDFPSFLSSGITCSPTDISLVFMLV